MMRRYFFSIFLVTALVISTSVSAAGRWYAVEVIVFRHALEASASDTERWPALDSVPDYHGAQEIIVNLQDFDNEPLRDKPNEVRIPAPRPFEALPRTDFKMSGVFRTLRNSAMYEPVLHVGWRQPGVGESRARSVYVSDRPASERLEADDSAERLIELPITAPRIEGTIRVRAGRLLYVTADFVNYSENSPTRIRGQRKVKLKELHYFDHPLFGVIVQVTPYRFAPPEEQDDRQTALLQ